jgi:hypothetical protein
LDYNLCRRTTNDFNRKQASTRKYYGKETSECEKEGEADENTSEYDQESEELKLASTSEYDGEDTSDTSECDEQAEADGNCSKRRRKHVTNNYYPKADSKQGNQVTASGASKYDSEYDEAQTDGNCLGKFSVQLLLQTSGHVVLLTGRYSFFLYIATNINTTIEEMEKKDYNVDIFLVYEEVGPLEGKAPPTARKDLCEFWNEKRRPFIKGYHVIAVNPTAQLYLARDLHNTVHGGFLRPAIKPFLQAISSLGFGHIYYGASVLLHNNPFLLIRNGRCVTELQSYSRLDFDVAMSRVNPTIVGQRWNSQYTWGVSSLNIKRNDLGDIVNRPIPSRPPM